MSLVILVYTRPYPQCSSSVQGNVGSCTIAVDVYKCSPRGSLYGETGVLIAPFGECRAHHVVVSLSGNVPVQYCSILVPVTGC